MIGDLATICALITAFEVRHAPLQIDSPAADPRHRHLSDKSKGVRGEGRGVGVDHAAQHNQTGERNNG